MNTVERVKSLIEQQFGIPGAGIDGDAPFAAYKIDSLTLAELMFAIEDEFKLTIPDELATAVFTLNQLGTALDALIAGQPLPKYDPPPKPDAVPAEAGNGPGTARA